MAFDTICVKKIVDELSSSLIGGKIDKVHQPEKDELLLIIRTFGGNYKLVLSASANNPRVHFTELTKENPKSPPMFCMLLRKHISGGKIVRIIQPDFERIIEIDIESYNELGDLTTKHLIIEITGRNSNVILTNEDYKIIDSAKHVDFTVSSYRQIIPGIFYEKPPKQHKTPILSEESSSISLDFSNDATAPEQVIMSVISGISPIIAREIVYLSTGTNSKCCGELSDVEKKKITEIVTNFDSFFSFCPCIIYDESEKPIDFSCIEINQYGKNFKTICFDSMNKTVQEFYHQRDAKDRIKQKSADLLKILHNNIERCAKKLAIQNKTLSDAENKDKYKIYGDIVTANLYRIKPGDIKLIAENYYEENCPEITIDLLPRLTASQNAQRYYKLYNKLKNAEIEVNKQIISTKQDLEYLESTLVACENSSTEADLNMIRAELSELGYIHTRKKQSKKDVVKSKPMHFVSSDGFDIYVGKNNTQNDYLTLRFANSGDVWFHTKNIHGSHTVIKLGIDKDIPKSTILEAAQLAAYFSKARDSSQVPVDYTQIKNVRKPNGAKPGMVIYESYNTVYVTPKLSGTQKEQ